MFNLRNGAAIAACAVVLSAGVATVGRTAAFDDPPADAKSAMDKLQFMVGRFSLHAIKAKGADAGSSGVSVENTLSDGGTTLHLAVHNGSAPAAEKVVTYDADKHVYHVKSVAEGADAEPELTGTLTDGALVLMQEMASKGSTGLLPHVHDGVIDVVKVFPGMAADKAGLKKGDVIVKIDGKSLTGMDYPNAMLMGAPDTDVIVTIRRKGEEKDVTIHRMGTVMMYQRTIKPLKGGGYRQITVRTDVHGVPGSGSDAIPVGK